MQLNLNFKWYDKLSKKLVDFLLPRLTKKYSKEKSEKIIQHVMKWVLLIPIIIIALVAGNSYSLDAIIFKFIIVAAIPVIGVLFAYYLFALPFGDVDNETVNERQEESKQRNSWKTDLQSIPGGYRDKYGNEYDYMKAPKVKTVIVKGDKK